MKKLKLSTSLNLHSYPKDNLTEHIRQGLVLLKDAGFEAADFPFKIMTHLGGEWQECIEKTIELSQEIGIHFEVCHLPFNPGICAHPEEVAPFNEAMHHAIDAAAVLGSSYAVVHPNTTSVPVGEFNRSAQYDSVMAHLSPFVEHANKVGVNIVVENMGLVHGNEPRQRYCQEPDELCDIADALGVGVCWDFGHGNQSGLNQGESINYIGKRLKVLHVNDNNGYGDDHVPPFCGNIDWKDAMSGLSNIGFDGLFNFEINATNHPDALRLQFAKHLVECGKELLTYL